MNTLEHRIIKVISEPYFRFYADKGTWRVKVEAECCGKVMETTLMYDTEEEVLNIKEGDTFLS